MHKLQELIAKQLAAPILRRVGTIAGTYMVTVGLPADLVGQWITISAALLAVGVDLIFSKLHTENVKKGKI